MQNTSLFLIFASARLIRDLLSVLSSQFHRFTLISVNGSIISNYNDIQMLQHDKRNM